MPWYALTWQGIDGHPIKREVLYREGTSQVWDFIAGRNKRKNGISDDWYGVFISEALTDETWDFDIDEPRERLPNAVEVPLVFGEKEPIE